MVICPKKETLCFCNVVKHSKDGGGVLNSADPDQTVPRGAV